MENKIQVIDIIEDVGRFIRKQSFLQNYTANGMVETTEIKILLHTHPGNDRIKKRHDYKCKCVLHGMKTIEERINAREKRKSKNKN